MGVGFLSGGPLYGLAEYHDFMKDAEAAGVPRDVARSKAIISGIAEGGLELAGDAILLAWNAVPGVRLAREAATSELKEAVVAPFMARFAGRILKTAAEEVPTEMAQAWAETSLRKQVGIDQGQSPWEAAKSVVGVTAGTSVLFALSGMGGEANQILAEKRNANAKVIADRVKANGGTITAQDLDDIVTYVAEPGKKLAFDFLRARKTPGGRETAIANLKTANPLYQEMDFDSPVELTPDEKRLMDAHGLVVEGKTAGMGVWFHDPVTGGGSMVLPANFTEEQLRTHLVDHYKKGWEKHFTEVPADREIGRAHV
jgi:hypothetical protein